MKIRFLTICTLCFILFSCFNENRYYKSIKNYFPEQGIYLCRSTIIPIVYTFDSNFEDNVFMLRNSGIELSFFDLNFKEQISLIIDFNDKNPYICKLKEVEKE